ncbi:hypothetical protein [Mastigocladopsis repens]|uniref:hypothetical protein n=1 Tax=Mastigocladopsis repens TaxID=221287 RepID=UPI000303BBBC|nr:hypothetical protein [Mastigocladopsis repens]
MSQKIPYEQTELKTLPDKALSNFPQGDPRGDAQGSPVSTPVDGSPVGEVIH